MRKIFSKKEKGFTLIELLVVIVIIGIVLTGVVALITRTIQLSSGVRNDVIAANLAQEGIEIVIGQRDDNWINKYGGGSADWDKDIKSGSTYKVYYDPNENDPNKSYKIEPDSSAPKLKIDTNGFYQYSSGTDTIFSREIKIDDIANGLKVTSTVQWNDRGTLKQVVLEDHLYNWLKP